MCGRFTLSTASDILEQLFEIDAGPLPALTPRYNIAPTQPVALVRQVAHQPSREMVMARWGLIPYWATDPTIGSRLVNARAESLLTKPAFRSAFGARRCLIPADGFYEWARENGKQPYLFRQPSGEPFGLAGLWERWRSPEGEWVLSCTIVTTDANAVVAPIHGRMPVVVERGAYGAWLDPAYKDRSALTALLRPWPEASLIGYRVGRRVNSPTDDDPELVAPID